MGPGDKHSLACEVLKHLCDVYRHDNLIREKAESKNVLTQFSKLSLKQGNREGNTKAIFPAGKD